jgi:hypothetical protein
MPGLGAQPLGTSPAGVGYVPAIPTLPSTSRGARYIGPDGNPVKDEVNGGFLKADPVAMRVYFAIRTTLKSASGNQALGVEWPKKIDARFEAQLFNSINVGLAEMIRTKVIKIESLSVSYPMPERYYVTLNYRNLITQKSQQVTV